MAYSTFKGWWNDRANSRLTAVFNGTDVYRITASAVTSLKALAVTGGITATTSHVTITAGDMRNTAGNARFGTVAAFATAEPVGAVVFNTTTKPQGAAANSGSVYAATNGTAVHKMVADGTESNIET